MTIMEKNLSKANRVSDSSTTYNFYESTPPSQHLLPYRLISINQSPLPSHLQSLKSGGKPPTGRCFNQLGNGLSSLLSSQFDYFLFLLTPGHKTAGGFHYQCLEPWIFKVRPVQFGLGMLQVVFVVTPADTTIFMSGSWFGHQLRQLRIYKLGKF